VTSALYLGYSSNSSGSYNLSGSGSLSATKEVLGYTFDATGIFTQSGGTNSAGSLLLGQNASSGTYNLAGGLLILTGSPGLTGGSGTAAFSFSGGTLQVPAPSFSPNIPIVFNVSGDNGTFDTHGTTLTLSASLSGPGGLNKAGAGLLVLAGDPTYTGATSVGGGSLEIDSDIPSTSSFTANGGTLLFNGATLNLNGRFIRAAAGGIVQYQNATINGGFFRGPGTHIFPAGFNNSLSNGTTIDNGAVVQQSGSTSFTDVINAGQINDNSNAILTWQGEWNASSGVINVSSSAILNVSEWSNDGVITINSGGLLNNSVSHLVSGGGSRIYVNSGGTLNADSNAEGVTLDLQGSLLVNNGTVIGTTNVYYGATVSGSGSFAPMYVLQGGILAVAVSANPIVPTLTVSSGSVTGAGQLASPIDIINATVVTPNPADTLTLSGSLAGAGLLVKSGAGTLILSGSGNTYSGGTDVLEGTLILTNPGAIESGTNLTVGNAAAFAPAAVVPAVVAGLPTEPPSPAITPVPEPGTLVLLAAAAALMAAYRKRR